MTSIYAEFSDAANGYVTAYVKYDRIELHAEYENANQRHVQALLRDIRSTYEDNEDMLFESFCGSVTYNIRDVEVLYACGCHGTGYRIQQQQESTNAVAITRCYCNWQVDLDALDKKLQDMGVANIQWQCDTCNGDGYVPSSLGIGRIIDKQDHSSYLADELQPCPDCHRNEFVKLKTPLRDTFDEEVQARKDRVEQQRLQLQIEQNIDKCVSRMRNENWERCDRLEVAGVNWERTTKIADRHIDAVYNRQLPDGTVKTYTIEQQKTYLHYAQQVADEFIAQFPDMWVGIGEGEKCEPHLIPWLLIQGPPGVGKTHLVHAIIDAITENDITTKIDKVQSTTELKKISYYLSFLSLYDIQYTNGIDFIKDIASKECIERYRKCTLLVIDDIGIKQTTEKHNDALWTIFDYRSNYALPTIITSNLDIDMALRSIDERIADRAARYAESIWIICESYRRAEAKQRRAARTHAKQAVPA